MRCAHRLDQPAHRAHHDAELGRPSADDARVFEKLVLEVFSAGLSFVTMLRRHEALRAAFDGYDLETVAANDDRDVARVLAAFVWSYEPGPATRPRRVTPAWMHEHPFNPESTAMAHRLKRRGFAIVGPVVAYGLMQSTGVVDDHLAGCEVGEACRRERAAFDPPWPAAGQGR